MEIDPVLSPVDIAFARIEFKFHGIINIPYLYHCQTDDQPTVTNLVLLGL